MLELLEEIARERVSLKRIREKYSKISQSKVSIITPTNKLKYIDNLFANYARLRYSYKELIIILNNNKMNKNYYKMKATNLKDVKIFQLDESCSLGECLNFGVEQSSYNYIAKMDDDDYYGTNYLVDLMNAFQYTNAEVVGKLSCFLYFENTNTLVVRRPAYANKYVHFINGSNLIIKKEVFQKIKFRNLTRGEDTQFFKDCNKSNIKIYASDKFNYVCMRHKDIGGHTWKMSSEKIMSKSKKLVITSDFVPIVTV